MDNVSTVSLGFHHTAAITYDNTLWMWGSNVYGQLGDGTTQERLNPVKIMTQVASVSLGGWSSAAIDQNGYLWTWGDNGAGQLGDGTTVSKSNPTLTMKEIEKVALGSQHSAAIDQNGYLWTWGDNGAGQLGDGTTVSRSTPICVVSGGESPSEPAEQPAAMPFVHSAEYGLYGDPRWQLGVPLAYTSEDASDTLAEAESIGWSVADPSVAAIRGVRDFTLDEDGSRATSAIMLDCLEVGQTTLTADMTSIGRGTVSIPVVVEPVFEPGANVRESDVADYEIDMSAPESDRTLTISTAFDEGDSLDLEELVELALERTEFGVFPGADAGTQSVGADVVGSYEVEEGGKAADITFVFPLRDSFDELVTFRTGAQEFTVRCYRYPVVHNGFELGRTNNSFANSKSLGDGTAGFPGATNYPLSKESYYKLMSDTTGPVDGMILTQKVAGDDEWDGCCFGMAMSMWKALESPSLLATLSARSVDTYYELNPRLDDALLEQLNYYQLSQYAFGNRGYAEGSGAVASTIGKDFFDLMLVPAWWSGVDTLPAFLEKLVGAAQDGPAIFKYMTGDDIEHAVLLLDARQLDNGDWSVVVYDENTVGASSRYGKLDEMTIASDFSGFVFEATHRFDQSNYKYMSIYDPSHVEDPEIDTLTTGSGISEKGTTVLIDGTADITLSDGQGRTLSYTDGRIAGSIPVLDFSLITGSGSGEMELQLDSAGPFTVTGDDGSVSLAIGGPGYYYSIDAAGADEVRIDPDGGLVATGSSISYKVYAGVDDAGEGVPGLVLFGGTATENVKVVGGETSATLSSDGELDNEESSTLRETESNPSDVTEGEDGSLTVTTDGGADEPSGPGGGDPDGTGNPDSPGDTPNAPSDPGDTPADPDRPCPSEAYADLDASAWYHDSVDWAIETGAMTGYADGSNRFGPGDPLLRGQAARVLWNLLGDGDETAPATALSDVAQGEWYSNGVNWAVREGYMNGYGDGSGAFGVGDALTREQFACVVANVAGADLSSADPSALDGLGGADEVSDWAEAAVAWAVGQGVINGAELEDGTRDLQPGRAITRAEMATMMKNAVDAGAIGVA